MRKKSAPKKPAYKRDPLERIGECIVLGSRYMFSRGKTRSGIPLLYLSIPGYPGVTILAGNLNVFIAALAEAAKNGFTENELTGPDALKPIPVEKPVPYVDPDLCPSLADTDRQLFLSQHCAPSDPIMQPHPFKSNAWNPEQCESCGYNRVNPTKSAT